jgi:apolipoprotein N-acyltransferase
LNISPIIQKAGRFPRSLICLALGALGALAMAPYYFWPVLVLSLSGFYLLLAHTHSAWRSGLYGWLFGFGYFFTGLFWVKNALLVDGNPFSWIWPLAVAGLPSLLAFFMAVGAFAAKRCADFKTVPGFLSFTAFLGLTEWARGFVFTGYPWNLFGYTWVDTLAMIQNVAVGNIFFLTWLTILWLSLPGFLILRRNLKRADHFLTGAVLISALLCLVFGIIRLQTASIETVPDVQIHIVQPNIAQSEKWDRSETARHFLKMVDLSKPDENTKSLRTIIVWPETALSFWMTQDATAMDLLTDMLKSYPGEAVLVTGLLRVEVETKSYFNSLVMIDKNGSITNIYDKHHLVPFGEYIPFQKWIPLKPVVEFSGFRTGIGAQTFEALGIKYSPVICYEIIFPGAVTGMVAPDLIINVTNDAWYGVSAGPYQHFDQAVVRAVEEGIPVVRSANTGFSGMIDSLGYVYEKSRLFREYEKTLALPTKIMSFNAQIIPKDIIFAGLMLLIASFGFFQNCLKRDKP